MAAHSAFHQVAGVEPLVQAVSSRQVSRDMACTLHGKSRREDPVVSVVPVVPAPTGAGLRIMAGPVWGLCRGIGYSIEGQKASSGPIGQRRA